MDFPSHFIWLPFGILVIGYILLQVMGRKSVTQMTGFDLFAVIVLGITMTEPMVSKSIGYSVYYALIIAIVFFLLSFIVRNKAFKQLVTDIPVVVVRNGEIDEQGLRKIKLTANELLVQLRQKGYTNIADLALVMREETGELSTIPMSDKRPLRPSDINISPSPLFIPIPIIMQGEVIEKNLKYVKKDMKWLTSQLQAYDISVDSISKVTLATLNQRGFLDVNTKKPGNYEQNLYYFKPDNSH